MNINDLGIKGRQAARKLAQASESQKNLALMHLAERLLAASQQVLAENSLDVKAAVETGLSPAMIDRLSLNPARLSNMADDLRALAGLPDPVGEVFEEMVFPNGLKAHKVRVPMGVLGVIYESRPNVTLDVAGVCIKTGNAAILRGGSETLRTNRVLVHIVQKGLADCGFPAESIQFIDDPDRSLVLAMLQMHEHLDMIIPRGGASLHNFCKMNSRVPVITGGIGICHLFVDSSADLAASLEVIRNAKIQRPSVCNALDTALVHRDVASEFIPMLVNHLEKDGVTFRAEPGALASLSSPVPESVSPAGPQDFDTEWLSLVLGLKVVDSLDQAIEHIGLHSTAHSDGILTRNDDHARRFVTQVDSAAVYVNASTRFTDGAQLGLGAEVAVSTQRLHARGPMGPRELTTYKWVVQGDYHVRK